MGVLHLNRLTVLIEDERANLLAEWRAQIRQLPSAKQLDSPTLTDHIPDFLDELAAAFLHVSDATIPETLLEVTPPAHGRQRYVDGFDIVEVVAEYNILRGCVHDVAERNGIGLSGKAFHIMNRVFDGAIGLAVQTFATRQALEVQQRREEYLAFVAHDLRTPLNAIALSARVIELKIAATGTDAGTGKMLKSLQRNVKQLEGLVDKILKESAHVETEVGVKLERREFDLWALVESLIHDLHPVAGTASTTLINAVPEGLLIYADAGLMGRVFQNLIANAIKYTSRGEVTIGAAKGAAPGSVECWVTDDGAGIAPDRVDKIFDKLETDGTEGGLGLGLAIVETFVQAHGGRVVVESVEGKGSTFRFVLAGKAGAE